MLFLLVLRSGLWRSLLDQDKIRLFFGWTDPSYVSWRRPLWRRIPWARALFSRRGAEDVFVWLRYRVDLYDGRSG